MLYRIKLEPKAGVVYLIYNKDANVVNTLSKSLIRRSNFENASYIRREN